MDSIPFGKLMRLKARDIKKARCFEVTSDGEYLCTVIVARTGFIRDQVAGIAELNDSISGVSVAAEPVLQEA
jgi:hypothetical protein